MRTLINLWRTLLGVLILILLGILFLIGAAATLVAWVLGGCPTEASAPESFRVPAKTLDQWDRELRH